MAAWEEGKPWGCIPAVLCVTTARCTHQTQTPAFRLLSAPFPLSFPFHPQ